MACYVCRCDDPAEFPLPSGGLCPCRCHVAGDRHAGMGAWLLGDLRHSLATSRAWAAQAYEDHGFQVEPLERGQPIPWRQQLGGAAPHLYPAWPERGRQLARALWAAYPHSNVGLVVGDRYVVLELDGGSVRTRQKNVGARDTNSNRAITVEAIEVVGPAIPLGEVPPTTTACAPDGRRQLWFSLAPGQRARVGELAPGIVANSRESIVTVPPSLTSTGARWRWTNVVGAASAPTWLLETNAHGDR